jgi:hypothetical protein
MLVSLPEVRYHLQSNDAGRQPMAPQRKRKNQEPAADKGDAYEPVTRTTQSDTDELLAGLIPTGNVDAGEFPPPDEPARLQAALQRTGDGTRMQPDPGDGKKEWVKSLTCITDPDTGMRFHFDYESHLGVITFVVEPSAAVKQKLNDGGYRYKPEVKAWLFPLTSGHWADDRKHAKKVFWQANGAVRAEMGFPPFAQAQDQGPIPD